ncbi:hypothetical protein F4821DRAFT_226213 [Hypoxylon rubiginosum]|uniref:Uncharacterized protein n=1 Tax=Hypoxylon rubiginosum TaxID=110542 RepID=A0ACC0DGZ9_9PEZI|nr:hypothetical protein F4821DRAFT_226213 [Hypoxylon rubiginosum]
MFRKAALGFGRMGVSMHGVIWLPIVDRFLFPSLHIPLVKSIARRLVDGSLAVRSVSCFCLGPWVLGSWSWGLWVLRVPRKIG